MVQGSAPLYQHKMLFNIVTLLALAPSVLSAATDNSAQKKRNVVPGGYIVEFEDVKSIASDVRVNDSDDRLTIDMPNRLNPVSILSFRRKR